jgi:hypothetical protein
LREGEFSEKVGKNLRRTELSLIEHFCLARRRIHGQFQVWAKNPGFAPVLVAMWVVT